VYTHCAPAAAAALPVLDGLTLAERIHAREAAEAKFEAALHDKELKR
jgi:hypothetical protein